MATDVKITAQYNLSKDTLEYGDFILVDVYIINTDTEELEPERLNRATVYLKHKNEVLTSVNITSEYKNSENLIRILFAHPRNVVDLTAKITGSTTYSESILYETVVTTINVTEDYNQHLNNSSISPLYDVPRIKDLEYDVLNIPIQQQAFEQVIQSEKIRLDLCYIDFFNSDDYFQLGISPIDYRGGGNRLLQDIETSNLAWTLQNLNVFPSTINTYNEIETEATNIFLYSNLTNIDTWLFEKTRESMILEIETEEYKDVITALKVRCRAIEPYTGITSWSCISNQSPITPSTGDQYMFSAYCKTVKGTTDTVVNNLDFGVIYYDSIGMEISNSYVTFDTDDYLNTWLPLYKTETPPINAASFSLFLRQSSFEGADDLTTYLLLPQYELGNNITTKIPTDNIQLTRLADQLSIPTTGNLELLLGSLTMELTMNFIDYTIPSYFLFDCRTENYVNGMYAYFDATDFTFNFVILNMLVETTLKSSPITYEPFSSCKVRFFWNNNVRFGIEYNGEIIALTEDENLNLPNSCNEILWLGMDNTGNNQAFSTLKTLRITRDDVE